MECRPADLLERDQIVRALQDSQARRFEFRSRAQAEIIKLCGQNSTERDVMKALCRHLAEGGELNVQDSEAHATHLRVDRVFCVQFAFRGRLVFSHFYLVSPESSLQCRVVFESVHLSNR